MEAMEDHHYFFNFYKKNILYNNKGIRCTKVKCIFNKKKKQNAMKRWGVLLQHRWIYTIFFLLFVYIIIMITFNTLLVRIKRKIKNKKIITTTTTIWNMNTPQRQIHFKEQVYCCSICSVILFFWMMMNVSCLYVPLVQEVIDEGRKIFLRNKLF